MAGKHAETGNLRAVRGIVIVDALLLAAISTGCLAVCEALSEAHGDARFAMLALGAGISFVAGLLAVMLMVKHVRDAMLPAVKAPCLPASRWASAIASRFALVFGAFVVVALASGAFALIMQLAIVPGFGSEVAKTAIRVFAQIAASAFLPFPVMVLASVAFQVAPGKPLQDVSRLRQAYVPLLVGVMAAGALGHGVLFAVQAVPNEVAATIVRDVALALLGSLWLVSALLVCAKASRADGLPGGRPPAHVRLSPKIAKAGRGVLSCLLAFTLVFSLFGSEPIAFAVEGDRLDPPDPIEQPSAANEVPVDVEPAELEAKGPVEYYEEDVPSGELVSVSGDATTYQTSAKTFETVVGGIDATYTDENGELQLIDNTLERVDQSAGAHYENSANAYTAKLPDAMADGEGLVVEKDGRQVELVPRDGDFTRSAVEGNAIRYTEVREGIDYQYTLVGSLIKEDIVLNKQVEPQEFATLVKVGPDMRVEERDGIAVVRDAGAQESDPSGDILSIAAPVAVDAAGSASDDVSLRVEWAGDGDALVVLSVDWDWLHAKERAYPVRIDPTVNIAPSAVRVGCVEQNWGNRIIGENNYAYAGYDDGVKSETASFNGIGHGMTRAYAAINYDFGNIMSEARINSATFSLHQFTRYSGGATNFGLYRVTGSWDFDNLTWDNQTHLGHELVRFQHASVNAGYVNWDVREVVNNWVQGLYPQRGFCVKAENERGMQCEVFSNRYSAYPPKLSINWEIPDPVGDAYPLSDTTVNVRPVNEVNADGKLKMDGVFADGVATPRSTVDYALNPSDKKGSSYASRSYKYPDSSPWDVTLPQATKYKDKLSNWQSGLFVQLAYDTVYRVRAVPALNGQAGRSVESEGFLVYRATQKDTLPYIAGHYGVSLDTLARDNKVQDTLVVNGNELFVRAPSTSEAYNPGALSEGQKRAIDSALMGRGKHCEYGFEPINLNTGNFVLESVDASIPEIEDDFSLLRTYNAKNEAAQSVFGRNWSFSYAESLSMLEGGTIAYQAGDGKTLYFDPDGAGGYDSPDGFNLKLSKIAYAEGDETRYRYEIEEAEGTLRSFNAWGLLDAVWSPKGLKTSISYDGNFHLESVTSPTGLKYVFTTDDRGRVSSAALPNGSTLRYAYDDAGNLASYADANGKTVRYEYDQDHRMTAWYDQNGTRVVSNEYDAQDRVVVQRDALDRASLLEYSDGTTRAIDAKGNVTVYRYDDQCRTTEIEHADGQIVKRSYDGNNELASDENGTYAYDNRGNLVRETSLDGIVTSYEYDAENRMTKRVEPDGTVVEHEYDATGNLVRSASTSGEDDTYSYDDLGRMVSHENADGDVETFSYSGAWKSTHTDFNGNTETYACNAMGLPVSTTNALGETSRIMYDAAGNRTGEQDASGAYTAYALDAAGFMLRMTDPRGFSTSFTYDGAYNITSMVGADGSVTRYEFDACNNQVRETDPLGAQTTCEYDSRNRLIRSTDAEGGTKTYAYDDRGNVTSVTDALGAETTVSYDRTYDAPTSVTDALGNTTAMAYTARGDMSRVTNPDSSEEVYEYGPGGRLTSETDEAGLVRTYAYTPAGKLVRIDEGGSSYELAYDANGSIVGLRDPLGGKTSVAYDAAGRPVRIDDAEGRTTAYAYDACGRLISEMDAAGNATIWSYDEAGNLTSEVDPNGNKTEFSYDELGRLASKTDALGGRHHVLLRHRGQSGVRHRCSGLFPEHGVRQSQPRGRHVGCARPHVPVRLRRGGQRGGERSAHRRRGVRRLRCAGAGCARRGRPRACHRHDVRFAGQLHGHSRQRRTAGFLRLRCGEPVGGRNGHDGPHRVPLLRRTGKPGGGEGLRRSDDALFLRCRRQPGERRGRVGWNHDVRIHRFGQGGIEDGGSHGGCGIVCIRRGGSACPGGGRPGCADALRLRCCGKPGFAGGCRGQRTRLRLRRPEPHRAGNGCQRRRDRVPLRRAVERCRHRTAGGRRDRLPIRCGGAARQASGRFGQCGGVLVR